MIVRRVKKILFCWFTVTACILVVACGGDRRKAPERPKAGTAQTQEQTANPQTQVAGTELDKDSSQSAQENVSGSDTGSEATTSESMPKVRVVTIAEEAPFVGPNAKPDDIRINPVYGDKIGTGAQNWLSAQEGQPLAYSGSGIDTLVPFLRDRLATADEAQQTANRDFASKIGLTALDVNWSTRQFTLTALLNLDGRKQHHSFVGRLNSDFAGAFVSMGSVPSIKGDVACLDLNGGCRNARVRFIETDSSGREREAYAVIRDTTAGLHVKGLHPNMTDNQEYIRFMRILMNSVKSPGSINSIYYLNFQTSETVNGSATFVVSMKLRTMDGQRELGEQAMAWTGPLVKDDQARSMYIGVSPVESSTYVMGRRMPVDTDRGYISDTIKGIRLTRNDGKGKIELEVTVRANKPKLKEEKLTMVVIRKHSPVKYLGL